MAARTGTTVEAAGAAYTAALAEADRQHTRATTAAGRAHDRATAKATAALQRADELHKATLETAGAEHAGAKAAALAELDAALREAVGAVPGAFLTTRAIDGVTELRGVEFGPVLAAMAPAGQQWVVDRAGHGREFNGSFLGARTLLWGAAQPARGG